jgi:hypothetical protein
MTGVGVSITAVEVDDGSDEAVGVANMVGVAGELGLAVVGVSVVVTSAITFTSGRSMGLQLLKSGLSRSKVVSRKWYNPGSRNIAANP